MTFLFGYISSIILVLLGAMGGLIITMCMPFLFAIIFNCMEYKSIKKIFMPFLKRVTLKSIIFMFLYPLIIIALCSILALVTKQGTLSENWADLLKNALALIPLSVIMFVMGLTEEYGWRGYLLPRWCEKYGLQKANIMVGITWAMYHFPYLFMLNIGNGIVVAIGFTILQVLTIFMFNFGFSYLFLLSQNVILASIMHLLWNNVNVQVLGDAYRNTLNSVILGNIKIINGECLFGLIFASIFAIVAYQKFNKSKI
jgi:membrane protease YdiL (CAAX protease family)